MHRRPNWSKRALRRKEKPIWNGSIDFADTKKIDDFDILFVDEFMKDIFHIKHYFISDFSTFHDMEREDETINMFLIRIRRKYGVEIKRGEDLTLARILGKIEKFKLTSK